MLFRSVKELATVRRIHAESNGSAGTRTIAQIATDRSVPLTRYRARKLMKQLGLVSCQLPKHSYKKAHQEHVSIPNILDRQFSPAKPNEVWVGDVTYIWAGNRWAYLVVVLDLYARKPIGWAMSYSPDTKLTSRALSMAVMVKFYCRVFKPPFLNSLFFVLASSIQSLSSIGCSCKTEYIAQLPQPLPHD